jgi:hypothetical protein
VTLAADASSLAVRARPSRSADTIVALAGSPTSAAISAMIGPVIIALSNTETADETLRRCSKRPPGSLD